MKIKLSLLTLLVSFQSLFSQELPPIGEEPEAVLPPSGEEMPSIPLPERDDKGRWKTAGLVLLSIAMVTVGLVIASSNDGKGAHSH